MKNLQEIITEAENIIEHQETPDTCSPMVESDCYHLHQTEQIISLISRTAHLVAEKALEAVPRLVCVGCVECDEKWPGGSCDCECEHHWKEDKTRTALQEELGEFLGKE